MHTGEIQNAVKRVITYCDAKMEAVKDGTGKYEGVSMRSAMFDLGYSDEQIDVVVFYCSDHGFENCLDHKVVFKNFEGNWEKPSKEVCYWGPDQLSSRLRSLR